MSDDADVDPTLADLERAGEVATREVLEYGRLFGGSWRTLRLSEARRLLAEIKLPDDDGSSKLE